VFNIVKRLSTHSGKLERLLGREHLESVSCAMSDWYGPDIPLLNARGVLARKGGDFVGPTVAGSFMSYMEYIDDMTRRIARGARLSMGAGFSGFSELLGDLNNPYRHRMLRALVGGTQSNSGRWNDTHGFEITGGAAPGGTAYVDSSDADFPEITNPASGDTQHLLRATTVSDGDWYRSTLLFDRLFGVTKTMNSTATEAVTGVPTRYQSMTPTDDDYIGGNFVYPQQRSNISAVAHNHTVCTYTDEGGNAATIPSVAGAASGSQRILDLSDTWRWFMPLEAGDVGIGALTQIQVDALIASGNIDYVIGHPLGWVWNVSRFLSVAEGLNNCLLLNRIFDDAALSSLHINSASPGGQATRMTIETVSS